MEKKSLNLSPFSLERRRTLQSHSNYSFMLILKSNSGPGWIYIRFSKPSYSNNDMHFWRLLMSHDRSGGTICSMCATSTVTQIVKKINPKETDCVFLGTNTMGHANGVSLQTINQLILKMYGVSIGSRLQNFRKIIPYRLWQVYSKYN